MHDRHAGEPNTVKPVYGEDSATDASSDSDESDVDDDAARTAEVSVVTWNTKEAPQPGFVVEALKDADVVCLQEVTHVSTEWLSRQLADEEFTVITQADCGAPWAADGHGVAVVVRTERFVVEAQKHVKLTSGMDRCLLTVRLRPKGTRMRLLVGTAHLESGPEGSANRLIQVDEVGVVMRDKSVDGAVFAGDLNLREAEVEELRKRRDDDSGGQTTSALGLGEDAWEAAGRPVDGRWTWSEGALPDNEHLPPEERWGDGIPKHRFDRMIVRGCTPLLSAGPPRFSLRRP